jgi:zinc finger CCHC domain-containing protein 9
VRDDYFSLAPTAAAANPRLDSRSLAMAPTDGRSKRDFKRQKYGKPGGGRGRGGGRGGGGGGPGRGTFPGGSRDGGIWKSKLVCFGCRGTGHSLRDCRVKKGGADGGARGTKTCYNCGSADHAARDCKAPNSNFAFAVCFLCNETGHLARQCPKNSQGIYINGGACKICKGTDHLAKDCPSKDKCLRCGEKGHVSSECPSATGGRFTAPRRVDAKPPSSREGRPRAGGDDLEDDFEDELGDATGRAADDPAEASGRGDGEEGEDDDGAEDLEWRRTDEGEDAPRGSKKRRDSGEGEEGRANTKESKKKRAKKERVVEF